MTRVFMILILAGVIPTQVAQAEERILVANLLGHTAELVDPINPRTLATTPVGQMPMTVAVTPDRRYGLVASRSNPGRSPSTRRALLRQSDGALHLPGIHGRLESERPGRCHPAHTGVARPDGAVALRGRGHRRSTRTHGDPRRHQRRAHRDPVIAQKKEGPEGNSGPICRRESRLVVLRGFSGLKRENEGLESTYARHDTLTSRV